MTSKQPEPSTANHTESPPVQSSPGQPPAETVTVFLHGTRAALNTGDLIEPGYTSNYGTRRVANFVYITANLGVAIWGAELAVGDDPERVYVVEPLGAIEDDPNVTDKRFPGNPTRSYRTREPVRVVGEVIKWSRHSTDALTTMKEHLQRSTDQGIEHIDE